MWPGWHVRPDVFGRFERGKKEEIKELQAQVKCSRRGIGKQTDARNDSNEVGVECS